MIDRLLHLTPETIHWTSSEQGPTPFPSLVPPAQDCIITIEDASRTRILSSYSPRTTLEYPCIALLDSDPPQVATQKSVWDRMLRSDASINENPQQWVSVLE